MHWLHYIGGYYTPRKFIVEARGSGVNRKVAPNLAKSFSFGDTVTCLYYLRGMVKAFAEFRIDKITLDGDIAQQVGEELARQGKAEYDDVGGLVVRECGSYVVIGGWKVKATIEEIVSLAQEFTDKLSCFVGGPLIKVYEPVWLQPAPKHFRGFKRAEGQTFDGETLEVDEAQSLVMIEEYKKRTKKERTDIQYRLPEA